MSPTTTRPHVLIIGGGIIGLSTAIALQDHPTSPYDVTIIAKDLPPADSSLYSADAPVAIPASYASAWAGAHHVSDAKNASQLEMDKTTYKVLREFKDKLHFSETSMSRHSAIIEVNQVEYFKATCDVDEEPECLKWYPDCRPLPLSALPHDIAFGCTFLTFDINVPQYLPRLLDLFVSLGGQTICAEVKSIHEGIEIFSERDSSRSKPDAIVISPGLGAIDLVGDNGVHPVRGQTVLIRAPWCTTTSHGDASWIDRADNEELTALPTWTGMSRVNSQGFRDMYILPRGDGTFILGGTRLPNDWDETPRQTTTNKIIQRALHFMPFLAIPSKDESVKQVDIVGINVGLRPARSNGIRLERGQSIDEVPVIYSYGYGGFGYQCSWGAAFAARNLIDDALHRCKAPLHSTIASLQS